MANDQNTIAVDDTVYFETIDDPNVRTKANFRGWSGDYACVVYNHGHQIMIERSRIFKTDIPAKEHTR